MSRPTWSRFHPGNLVLNMIVTICVNLPQEPRSSTGKVAGVSETRSECKKNIRLMHAVTILAVNS
jgi:hypothetical protein